MGSNTREIVFGLVGITILAVAVWVMFNQADPSQKENSVPESTGANETINQLPTRVAGISNRDDNAPSSQTPSSSATKVDASYPGVRNDAAAALAIAGAKRVGESLCLVARDGRELGLERTDFPRSGDFEQCLEDCLRAAKIVDLGLPPGVSPRERDAFLRRFRRENPNPSPAVLEQGWQEFLQAHPRASEHLEYERRLEEELEALEDSSP